jgi:hypothetical protein
MNKAECDDLNIRSYQESIPALIEQAYVNRSLVKTTNELMSLRFALGVADQEITTLIRVMREQQSAALRDAS